MTVQEVWDMCNNEWFTYAFEQFVWTLCNLVSYPDDDWDNDENMLVINNMW